MSSIPQDSFAELFDQYELAEDAEINGVWVGFRGGLELRLIAENSKAGRTWGAERARKLRGVIVANDGIFPPGVADKNDVDIICEVLAKDWRHPTKTLPPFTREGLRALLLKLPSFRRDVIAAVRMDETFRKAALEAMAGNSLPSSVLTSPPADGSAPLSE